MFAAPPAAKKTVPVVGEKGGDKETPPGKPDVDKRPAKEEAPGPVLASAAPGGGPSVAAAAPAKDSTGGQDDGGTAALLEMAGKALMGGDAEIGTAAGTGGTEKGPGPGATATATATAPADAGAGSSGSVRGRGAMIMGYLVAGLMILMAGALALYNDYRTGSAHDLSTVAGQTANELEYSDRLLQAFKSVTALRKD